MSATVDAKKIAEYFGGCPTLHVPGRTFPVDVRYLEDALETTRWWISESSPYANKGLPNLSLKSFLILNPVSRLWDILSWKESPGMDGGQCSCGR